MQAGSFFTRASTAIARPTLATELVAGRLFAGFFVVIAFSVQLEPHVVLEVPAEASLEEIRDAYHRQAKKLHPDAGGAAWAFRILAQAYETLSTARVERASRTEPSDGSTSASDRSHAPFTDAFANEGDCVPDPAAVDPSRRIRVEMLWVRYEDEPQWLRREPSKEELSVSCSLNFRWPDVSSAEPSTGPVVPAEVESILGRLIGVFETLCVQTNVATSRVRVNDDSFTGWLSYPTVEQAAAAYRILHDLLVEREFAVHPMKRELLIPRTWR